MNGTFSMHPGVFFLLLGIVIGALLFPRCPSPKDAAAKPVPDSKDAGNGHGNGDVIQFESKRKAG